MWDQDYDENEDAKFLMRLGLLEIADDANMFNISDNQPSSPFESCDDLNVDFCEREIPLHQKIDQNNHDLFLIDELCFDPATELSMKEKELMAEGLPILKITDDNEHDIKVNQENNELPPILSTKTHSINHRIDEIGEEEIDTTRQDRKKSTEYNNMLERKAFRMMRKYFKSTFETFAAPFQYKTRVKTMNPEEMDTLVFQYIKREFEVLSDFMTANDLPHIILGIKQIILSDRFNKGERVI
jgi:hypothetical protein